MEAYSEIENLIEKYYKGETSLEEEKRLRVFFQGKDIPGHLKSYQEQFLSIEAMRSVKADRLSEDVLFAKVERKIKETGTIPLTPNINWFYRIAAAAALVLLGYFAQDQFGDSEVDALKEELAQMKRALLIGLGGTSASGRLQAVSNSLYFDEVDDEIVSVLIATMSDDPNVHVRTKAIETLVKLGGNAKVKRALTNALLEEKEPTVQIVLIEAMVVLRQKTAIEALQKITEDYAVLKEVRNKAYTSLFKLKKL